MDPIKKRRIDENGVAMPDTLLTVDDARKILETLTHDQMLCILQNALLHHSDVLDAVRSFSDRDITQRKLFIRGMGWETTTEKLRSIFSSYGELDEAAVILDKVTGKSKGYGFITFKHIDGAIMALKEPSKKIDGRMTVTQLASAGISSGGAAGVGGVGGAGNPRDVSARKIYVANVPYDMPSERLLQHFSMYGEIEEGPLGFDKDTGRSKGFALFVYKTVEAARASLVDPIKKVDGHPVSCKLAVDGKRGKPPGGATGPTGVPGSNHGNGDGIGRAMSEQYDVTGGVGCPYGGYSGGLGVTAGAGVDGSRVLPSGNVTSGWHLGVSSGYASNIGGPYAGGSNYGGPYAGGSNYGGPIGGASSGSANGFGSLAGLGAGTVGGYAGAVAVNAAGGASGGGTGRGSSLYGFTPSSAPMVSGDKPGHYGLSSGGYHGPPSQPSGTSKVPPGGGYQGMPPYY